MEFGVLGPLEVRSSGAQVALGTAKQRALLAILLVHANELVSSDRLIDELWPEPPETAANALQVYVGKLRKALEPERARGAPGELLVTRAPGYMLRVEPDELDADRFERLLGEGRRAGEAKDPATAANRLRTALELWRGPALVDFAYDPFAQAEIARLEELRLDAIEERLAADLALGGAADLVAELEALVRDNPLRERLRGQLMLALYRSGRQADALEVYRQTRETLDEELGLAPSPLLQRLQAAILRQEPALEISLEAPAARAEQSGPPPDATTAAASEVRKTVTVLIARRAAVRGLDPEALRSDEERYRAHLARTVGRYGGTIASSLGNEVMAVFGIPRVHEDDAVRAVSAALEIRDAPARERDRRRDRDRGDPGERFGRRQAVGRRRPRDGRRRARGRRRRRGDPARRGDRAAHPRDGDGRSGRDRGGSRLAGGVPRTGTTCGRIAEGAAGRANARARPGPEGVRAGRRRTQLHLLTILGTAGIGKSRLAQELAALAAGRSTVLVGRCVPYGEGITFWSLREMLSQLTAEGPPDEKDEVRRLAYHLQEAVGAAETSVDREEIFWATRSLFAALARERPLVLFFEDVHWAEPTFLDLVEYLTEREPDVPILLVCIARLELLEERPGWGSGRPNASSLLLDSLPDTDCEALIGNLAAGLADETKARVLETAEGNPLFIEQLVAMLTEGDRDTAELAVPPTIDALLSARLDRLGPGERAVISRAAVAGKEFSPEAIVHLLPEDARGFIARHLETLDSKELIGPAPVPGGGEGFRFRHILIQEAAYRATPKGLRAELHERFAAWVDDPARDGLAEHSEIAGYHLERAFRYRAELGPVGERELALAYRACEQLAAAGQRAFQRGDMPATVNLLGRAAELPTPRGGTGLAVLPELGYALFEIGEVDRASTVLAEARARARAEQDRGVEWRVAVTRTRIEMYRDPEGIDLDAVSAETETAIEVLGELGDEAGLARAWMVLSDILWSNGRLRETSDAATRAAEHARRAGNRREVGWALGQNALCAIHGPMPVDEGLDWLEGLLRAEPENRTLDANLSGFVTVLEAMSGRVDEARSHIAETRALARDLGLIWQAGVQELLSGYVELLAGDPVAAERDMRTAAQVFREIGEGWFLSTVAVDLPRAVYEQGRYDDALALLDDIDEVAGAHRPRVADQAHRRPRAAAGQAGAAGGGRTACPPGSGARRR